MEKIPDFEKYSRNFDIDYQSIPKKKKQYIPLMSHLWKHASYINYIAILEHRKKTLMFKIIWSFLKSVDIYHFCITVFKNLFCYDSSLMHYI